MFTVCPKCTLTLSVTAGDLRTGQGYVRCGRCSNVFNALLTLTEQPPETAPSAASAPATPTGAQQTKVATAPAAAASAASDVASSIQIDQILMLGGSAFPRPQAAAPQRAPSPPPRRSPAAPTSTPARPARTDSAEAAPSAAPAPRSAPLRARAPAPPPSAQGGVSAEVQAPADRADANHPLPPARRPTPSPPSGAPKSPAAASPAASPVTPPRPAPGTRSAEPTDSAPADEAELIERSGNHRIEGHTVETIVLEGDGFTQTEEFVSAEQAGLAALRRELENLGEERAGGAAASGARTGERAGEPGAVLRRVRSFRLPGRASTQTEVPDLEAQGEQEMQPADASSEGPLPFVAPSRPYRSVWLAGSVALALLLALQAINHWRDALAAAPSVGSIVTRGYAALGVTLAPQWDLAAYEVRQQGAESDPKDTHVIHVRLSLANHAARAQPVPVLRLTLLDRYGKRIAQRDLAPQEYWPRGHTPPSFLSADQRIDSEVAVRDPNADSASFELDVCLRTQTRLRCAMESAPATANLLTP
jgi:predicted Zn finger-like uncharacterized protein